MATPSWIIQREAMAVRAGLQQAAMAVVQWPDRHRPIHIAVDAIKSPFQPTHRCDRPKSTDASTFHSIAAGPPQPLRSQL